MAEVDLITEIAVVFVLLVVGVLAALSMLAARRAVLGLRARLDSMWQQDSEALEADRRHVQATLTAIGHLATQLGDVKSHLLSQLADLATETQRQSEAAEERRQMSERTTRELFSAEAAQVGQSIGERLHLSLETLRESFSMDLARLGQTVTSDLDRFEKSVDERIGRKLAPYVAQSDDMSARVSGLQSRGDDISNGIAELAAKAARLEDLVRSALLRESSTFPVEESLPDCEEDLVALAESLVTLRPLVPYPHWRFDADWYNPDLSFRLRQRLWQRFTDRRCEAPVKLSWHLGTHLLMYLDNDLSRQIFIAGCIDPNEFAFLDRLLTPGMTFLDVGANEGVYSVFAAKRLGNKGTVWAFEPSVRELGRLQTNIESNRLGIRIFPVALGEFRGRLDLIVAENRHAGLNTFGKIAYEGVNEAGRESAEITRLDDVITANPLDRIDVIKIDVEGAELRTLRGAVVALDRYRPILLFEVLPPALASQETSANELMDFVRAQRYALHRFDPRTGLPGAAAPGEFSENMIAVPMESTLPESVYRYWPMRAADASASDRPLSVQ